MRFIPGPFGNYEEWRVDRLGPRMPRRAEILLRVKKRRRG
jgi:hypothetical protein